MESLTLDIRTLNIIIVLFSLLYAVGLFIYQTTQQKSSGLKPLAAGIFLIGVGPFLIVFRGIAPDWLTIVVANSFIHLGFLCTFYGISLIRNFKSHIIHVLLLGFVISVGALYFFTYPIPSINFRIAIVSAYMSATSFATFWALIKGKHDDAKLPVLLMAIPFLSLSIMMFVRIFYGLYEPQLTNYLMAGKMHAFSYVHVLILLVSISLSMLWLFNSRLVKSIHHLSLKDPLTGLYNRRVMDNVIPNLVARAKERKNSVSLIMTDIDNFKAINDEFGHIVGDDTIEKVAKVLTQSAANSENIYIVRFGGDEFMILLLESDINNAYEYAENLRKQLLSDVSVSLNGHPCTMSFGVAELGLDDNLDELLENADSALYQAKNLGRNQVVSNSSM
ncbi:hypothetical protein ATY36_13490 [Vibrio cidicii]|uniref:GGDEF domain-containing protein n=1 Tax=Vibrio cidicii TaxID=1763883 RepID=UPI00078002A4|nr:GGDEF domain-containing protein [Vibrio cidicii]KYN82566.1 hypothetical protein ATY36_13490 [Vibrio cidicii]